MNPSYTYISDQIVGNCSIVVSPASRYTHCYKLLTHDELTRCHRNASLRVRRQIAGRGTSQNRRRFRRVYITDGFHRFQRKRFSYEYSFLASYLGSERGLNRRRGRRRGFPSEGRLAFPEISPLGGGQADGTRRWLVWGRIGNKRNVEYTLCTIEATYMLYPLCRCNRQSAPARLLRSVRPLFM